MGLQWDAWTLKTVWHCEVMRFEKMVRIECDTDCGILNYCWWRLILMLQIEMGDVDEDERDWSLSSAEWEKKCSLTFSMQR